MERRKIDSLCRARQSSARLLLLTGTLDGIRQRGDVGGSAKKVGKRIKELERLYGIREGRPEKLPNSSVVTQEDLAAQFGISVDTLQNYKMLSEMIPELDELVETGIVTKTTALAVMKNLPPDEQKDFIDSLSTDKKFTQRQDICF
ncbi:MAG: hypothetical protein Q4F21_13150 [Lachnospiraceae bacterium]|nr:hypothetical protein [Lachnospiraceae bacterium]